MPNPYTSADRAHEKSLNDFEARNDAWEREWALLFNAFAKIAEEHGHYADGYSDIIEKAAADLVDLTNHEE